MLATLCAIKMQQRLESKQLYCACVELGNPRSSVDEYALKAVQTWLCMRWNGVQKVKYTWALRFLITWREWERSFQCELLGSLVYICHVSRSGKNDANTEETTADGMENLVFNKIKDCFLNLKRWTCWFCLCCLSHGMLWGLSLNVLNLFDSSVFVKRSGVAYHASSYSFMLITLYKLVCCLLFYCCCAFQLRITINQSFNHLF